MKVINHTIEGLVAFVFLLAAIFRVLVFVLLIISMINLFGLLSSSWRAWFFHEAPYERFYVNLCIFIGSFWRFSCGLLESENPYLAASASYRMRKGLEEAGDYVTGPIHFKNPWRNAIYLVLLTSCALWILWEENGWELYPILDWLGWVE